MISNSLLYLLGALVTLGALAARLFFWFQGRNKEKLKEAEGTLETIDKANQAINRARADDALAQRLLDTYNIKK